MHNRNSKNISVQNADTYKSNWKFHLNSVTLKTMNTVLYHGCHCQYCHHEWECQYLHHECQYWHHECQAAGKYNNYSLMRQCLPFGMASHFIFTASATRATRALYNFKLFAGLICPWWKTSGGHSKASSTSAGRITLRTPTVPGIDKSF